MPHVRREPPRMVHVLANNCAICGRELTDPTSMRAGVGPVCIQRYGHARDLVPTQTTKPG